MDQREDFSSLYATPPATGSPWLASYLLERQVVHVETLEPLGRVADVLFDPERREVVGLTVRPGADVSGLAGAVRRAFERKNRHGAIALDHVVALNGDVVTVDAHPIRRAEAPQLDNKLSLNEMCELVILTTYGKSLGLLADVLLDHRGVEIIGYVIKPTQLAASLLPRVEDVTRSVAPDTSPPATKNGAKPAPVPGAKMRIVPASSRLRFGDSLIMLVTEVEPLQRKVVVISQAEDGRVT